MAKAKLKVFRTQIGFVDAVVAVPSQAAALKAWGVQQNLFAEKMAAITEETAAVDAALAHPGVVLQRPVGSKGAFTESPSPADIMELSRPPTTRRTQPAKPKPTARDRAALQAAEAAVTTLETAEAKALAKIDRAREDLDAREAEVRDDFARKRQDAERRLDQATRRMS